MHRRLLIPVSFCLTVALAACSGAQDREEALISDSDFHYQLAIGHYQAREIPIAIQELFTALEFYEDNADALFLLGFIYQGRLDYDQAEDYYVRALEIRPEWPEVQNNLGVVYLSQERWDDAIVIYEELVRNPTYQTPGHAHNNLGWALYNLGLVDDALEQFELAVMFQPEHCLAYNNQGIILDEQGHHRDAQRAFENAIDRCEEYAEPRYRLGVILVQTGSDYERAEQLFQECYDTMPDSSYGQRCAEYLSVYR